MKTSPKVKKKKKSPFPGLNWYHCHHWDELGPVPRAMEAWLDLVVHISVAMVLATLSLALTSHEYAGPGHSYEDPQTKDQTESGACASECDPKGPSELNCQELSTPSPTSVP